MASRRVRAGFALSYRYLGREAARLYRLLGLLSVPDFTAWVGAELLDCGVLEAERHIEHLVDAQFLEVVGIDATGRLRCRRAAHRAFTIATDIPVYLCNPASPWQRGSKEDTNSLLRQYFPEGADLSRHTRDELNTVAAELNSRPRETLGWENPAERLSKLLAA